MDHLSARHSQLINRITLNTYLCGGLSDAENAVVHHEKILAHAHALTSIGLHPEPKTKDEQKIDHAYTYVYAQYLLKRLRQVRLHIGSEHFPMMMRIDDMNRLSSSPTETNKGSSLYGMIFNSTVQTSSAERAAQKVRDDCLTHLTGLGKMIAGIEKKYGAHNLTPDRLGVRLDKDLMAYIFEGHAPTPDLSARPK